MRDYILPPEDVEAAARVLDPTAWCSASTQGEAFELRYRRYRAREAAGWPNDLWPRPVARERSDTGRRDRSNVTDPGTNKNNFPNEITETEA